MKASFEIWIDKAEKDLDLAKESMRKSYYDYVLFHAQQAIEKFLKAYLAYKKFAFGKTHNIRKLIDSCIEIESEFEKLLHMEVDKLYPIGIESRYPYLTEITKKETEKAIEMAEKVREFELQKFRET